MLLSRLGLGIGFAYAFIALLIEPSHHCRYTQVFSLILLIMLSSCTFLPHRLYTFEGYRDFFRIDSSSFIHRCDHKLLFMDQTSFG